MQDLSHQGQDEIDSEFYSITTSSTRLSGKWRVRCGGDPPCLLYCFFPAYLEEAFEELASRAF